MKLAPSIRPNFLASLFLMAGTLGHAEEFVCAGFLANDVLPTGVAAKVAQRNIDGTMRALVLFAKFHGEVPGQTAAPSWSARIFDSELPGSFSHFYHTMSFGKLEIGGEVIDRRYESERPATAYISDDPLERGNFGRFSLEILALADTDVDFSLFDNDGPDGLPYSGDDDGVVDAVFIIMPSVPVDFLRGASTGASVLGFSEDYSSGDVGAGGTPIRISARRGTIQQGRSLAETVGRNGRGRTLASGVYLYRQRAGGLVETRKMLLLR